jgi:hypothetical protein
MEHTYESILGLIQARGKPVVSRRVANNTYAERLVRNETPTGVFYELEPDDTPLVAKPTAVGIRLHENHIVIFTRFNELILDHYDILTQTTLNRLNEFSPLKVLRGAPWAVAGPHRAWIKSFVGPLLFERNLSGEWAPVSVSA